MKETLVDARWIGEAFAIDPELELPVRPRVPPELLVVPFGTDGLILVGGREKELLKGRSARTLVPRVLPFLDGEHTLDQIAARFPDQPAHAVRDVVALLYHRGLLEDGRAEAPPESLRPVDAFLGRYNDVTRINRNRGQALRRLADATVIVGGEANLAGELASSLTASGVGSVRVSPGGAVDAGCDLVVAVLASGRDHALLEAARGANVLSLATWMGRDAVLLGPLNVPGQSACYACLRARGLPGGEPDPATASFWAQMTALRAIHLLSRISSSASFESYQVVRLGEDGAATDARSLPRTPGCDRCGLAGPPIEEHDPAYPAWSLYNATCKPPAALVSAKDYELHYSPGNLELAREDAPALWGAKVVPLPPPRPLAGSPWRDPPPPARDVDLSALATLLARAAGFHLLAGSVRRRVAPTGGDLGSVELGLVVSSVEGLEPGVYRYHAPRHVLERLPSPSAGQRRRALGADVLPPAVIVGIGGLAKVFRKYGVFAYRIVHFDAGVATAYLHRLAAALGLAVCELADFRDDAAADLFLLDLEHAVQIPTFAIGVGGEPSATRPAEAAPLQQVIEASASRRRAAPRLTRAAAPDGSTALRRSLDEALLERRSVRSYTDDPIPAALLRELCALGSAAAARRVACGLPPSLSIHLVLAVAEGGSDLAPGVYHVRPGEPEILAPGRRGLTRDDLLACLLQSAHAAAPAVLFVAGDLGSALADRGARGLRELMVQAGAAVGEVWLAASASGLGACAAGGVIESGLRAMAGGDGYRSAPLLAIALGYPRAERPA
ncbi:MAG TPA: nitroreductase family protein [Longimicrobium sp.]|nr:nitroreductase family protein [Longimicrobium sp.]